MNGVVVEVSVAVQPAQAALAHLGLDCADVGCVQVERRVAHPGSVGEESSRLHAGSSSAGR